MKVFSIAKSGSLPRATLLPTICVLLFGTIRALAAQGDGGTVSGIVRDQSGIAIPGARITLTNDATSSSQSTETSKDGKYVFTSVPAGAYTVKAEAQPFKPEIREHITVTVEQPATVDFVIVPSSPAGEQEDHNSRDANSLSTRAGYYDETPLKPSAVNGSVDPGGYSSPGQARTSSQLLRGVAGMKKDAAAQGNREAAQPAGPDPTALAALEAELKQALTRSPKDYEANHNLGEFYLHAGNLLAGIPYLEKAQHSDLSHYDNGYDLALAYLETRNLPAARAQIRQMLPKQDTAELHNLLGEVEENSGEYIVAANEYERAAHMEPSAGNIFDWGSELLLHLAYEPAIEVFRQGVARYPKSPELQIGLGVALYSRGRYDEAIKALCVASDLAPSDPRPYLFLGKMYDISAVSADEVTPRLERFVKVQPQNAMAQYYYAMSVWKGQRGQSSQVNFEQIESLLQGAVALDPQLPDAHQELGILYSDQRKYPAAIQEFQQVIKLQPNLLDAHYRLAQAYSRTGEQGLAQQEFEIHDRLHKQQIAETDKQRAEIKQFVYSMKETPKP